MCRRGHQPDQRGVRCQACAREAQIGICRCLCWECDFDDVWDADGCQHFAEDDGNRLAAEVEEHLLALSADEDRVLSPICYSDASSQDDGMD